MSCKIVGIHLLLDIEIIQNHTLLTTTDTVQILLDSIVKICKVRVIDKKCHQFVPHGVTCIYLLAESHISIHTYPENRSCYVDIFSCNAENINTEKIIEIINTFFGECQIIYSLVNRGGNI